MKKVVFLFVLLIQFAVAYSQSDMTFEKTSHDFGQVKVGSDTLWVDFKFTNKSSEAVIISDVKTSCDCTLAEWPKGAIAPGKSAVIRGGYKTAGKPVGAFNKNIIIQANTMPATTILTMKGEIVP